MTAEVERGFEGNGFDTLEEDAAFLLKRALVKISNSKKKDILYYSKNMYSKVQWSDLVSKNLNQVLQVIFVHSES